MAVDDIEVDYTKDYAGPAAAGGEPGAGTQNAADTTPDFSKLFPIPNTARNKDAKDGEPSRKKRRHESDSQGGSEDEDEGEDDSDEDEDESDIFDSDFWLSPRMAYMLWFVASNWTEEIERCTASDLVHELPRAAVPYARSEFWRRAYAACGQRLAARLAKGLAPNPNCTGEEHALHQILDAAEDMAMESGLDEDVEFNKLPVSHVDQDFDLVRDAAFLDHDVLMLYEPGVAQALIKHATGTKINAHLAMMDIANIHPKDWFKPFRADLVHDHE